MDCSTPGSPVLRYPPERAQIHVHWVGDAISPFHPLLTPSPFAFNLFQHQGLFQLVNPSHQVAKVLEFQLQHSPSNEYSGLISSRMDWLDLLAVQGTLKSLLQHHSSKASILQCSGFFIVQLSLITNNIILLKCNKITIQYTVRWSPKYLVTIHHHTEYNLFFLVRTPFVIFSVSNFQIYNAMLLTIVTILYSVVLNLLGIRDWFHERQDFPWTGGGDGLRMIQEHYIYCALYFYYYYISSTSNHQALDPRDWGPLT